MTDKRQVSNPLALAVLSLLRERPMHPYEIATVMRERHLHESIKLNYGSLYTVVEALQREDLIVPQETLRNGRRPERTLYALTEAGRTELFSRLRELLSKPVKEYTQFAAGLAFIAHFPPVEAIALLEEREGLLEQEINQARRTLDACLEQGVRRLFLIEVEHGVILREAELAWVRKLVREIKDGTLEGTPEWNAFRSEPDATSTQPSEERAAG